MSTLGYRRQPAAMTAPGSYGSLLAELSRGIPALAPVAQGLAQGAPARARCGFGDMEMLPGDVWGAMPGPDEEIDGERLTLFDRLAELTRDPDVTFADLTAAYAAEDRLRVPATVYNASLRRPEPVGGGGS